MLFALLSSRYGQGFTLILKVGSKDTTGYGEYNDGSGTSLLAVCSILLQKSSLCKWVKQNRFDQSS